MKFDFNFYILLGVDCKALGKEIKKAYRKLSKKYHPDNLDTGDETIFKKLNTAYSILKNPEKRMLYDLGRWDELEPESDINLSEAEQNIVALFCSNLDSFDGRLGYECLKIIVRDIMSDLRNEISEYGKKLVKLECSIAFLKSLKDKISFRGERTKHNLIHMALEQNLSLKTVEIQNIKDQEILAKEMLNIMKDFTESGDYLRMSSGAFNRRNIVGHLRKDRILDFKSFGDE